LAETAPTAPKGSWLALAVAVVALLFGVGAVSFVYLGSYSQIPNLQSQISSLQSGQGKIPANLSLVNQPPLVRNITIQWELFSVTQDRFFPNFIVVNQGDTIHLTFIDNDTGDAHTLTTVIPTTDCPTGQTRCEYQLNLSAKGLSNFISKAKFGTGPLNCKVAGSPVACSTVDRGPVGNMSARVTFTLTQPGLYKFFCFFHQGIGMFGWLVVLPNQGFKR